MFENKTIEATIGDGKVKPKGLERGLIGMCMDDVRTLIIHPDLAYGRRGERRLFSW